MNQLHIRPRIWFKLGLRNSSLIFELKTLFKSLKRIYELKSTKKF